MNTKSKAIGYINNPDGNANIEKKKQELFYLAPDFPTSIVRDANTIASQAARIAELEAGLKQTLDTLRIYSYTEYRDAEAARALLETK